MSKKIVEIPYWGVFVDCFPDKMDVAEKQKTSLITDDQWWAIARWWRDALLNESDWSQVSDNSLTPEKREEWKQYRKSLRDLTGIYTNPKNIVFPDLPAK